MNFFGGEEISDFLKQKHKEHEEISSQLEGQANAFLASINETTPEIHVVSVTMLLACQAGAEWWIKQGKETRAPHLASFIEDMTNAFRDTLDRQLSHTVYANLKD